MHTQTGFSRRTLPVANEHSSHYVAHQFDDLEQQKEAGTLGMWTFLATEILFFGGMFMAYFVYRFSYPDAFAAASHYMDILLGGINTGVLLVSSLTMALAVHAAQEGKRKQIILFLIITMVFGVTFLVIKGFEYHHKYVEHLVPGWNFEYKGPNAGKAEIYFILYFVMTGFHALHLIIGIGVLSVIAMMTARGNFTKEYYSPVEVSGLYWHFIDIVWIFLYPLLYLIHVHK
ncbi:MAG: cytochrome c oxidase subunit 3 family protein [Bacteroidota bacterium]|nr:cytochrome c oxidase subunit 3 family protein [Bacteroidota bacterium]